MFAAVGAYPGDTPRRLDVGNAEATGCIVSVTECSTTSIGVMMRITLPGLAVEIWEMAKAGLRLSADLNSAEARFTTTSTGQHRRGRLQPSPAAWCALLGAT